MASRKTAQFKAALAYILHHASVQELEILTTAIHQRAQTAAGNGQPTSPDALAQQMSRSISQSLDANMEGIRRSLRNYAAKIIIKEAPEIPQETLSVLLDSWVPSSMHSTVQSSMHSTVQSSMHSTAQSSMHSTAQRSMHTAGKTGALPPQALYEMILQFVSYSVGEMKQEEYRELAASMGNWTTRYWQAFPPAVKREIKAFLTGSTTAGKFRRTIQKLLTTAQEPV